MRPYGFLLPWRDLPSREPHHHPSPEVSREA